jgi:8-oxo-dGTP pyrophosphatase MutT (NUDIX family)
MSSEQKILNIIKEFSEKLPKFSDGRIDYSNSNIAPVIIIFIKYKNEILLLKRSDKVRTYQGKWNTVAGYLDGIKPIQEKALEEIQEETKINQENILSIQIRKFYEFNDREINKTWIIVPVLAELKNKCEIKLDWEHLEYKWIDPKELKNFNVVSNLEESFKRAMGKK